MPIAPKPSATRNDATILGLLLVSTAESGESRSSFIIIEFSPGCSLLPGIRAQRLLVSSGTKQGRIAANVNDITSQDFFFKCGGFEGPIRGCHRDTRNFKFSTRVGVLSGKDRLDFHARLI